MEKKKQSLVELAKSLGFKQLPSDDPIYTQGIFIITSVSSELERIEAEIKDEIYCRELREKSVSEQPKSSQATKDGGEQ